MGNTEWTDEQRAWIKTRRKRHLRILAAVLSLCVLFATYPNILETFFVFAAEREKEEKDLYISGFSDLSEEIKEQTVAPGTGLEELALPDTLEAVVVQDGQGSAENSDEDADDREIGDVDEETDAKIPSDKDESGEETGEPSDGEETGEETTGPSDGEESGGETAEPSGGEETGGETAESSDEEETGGETAEPSDGEETEGDNSGSTEETEDVDQVEQDTQLGEADGEDTAVEETIITESGDETDGVGDSTPSSESEDTEFKQETHAVTLPEYQAEHVITVERLENPSEKENKEDADDIEKSQAYDTDTVIITGVTWRSAPAYDKDTEGVYLFTAVLPEGYARMEGIGLPRITVTVAQTGTKPRRVAARAAEHTVTYNYNANGGTSAEKTSDTVSEGALIDLAPSASKEGWEFVGWNTSKTAKTGLITLTMGADDVTLYAIYKKTLYYDFYSGKTGDKETRTATIYNNEMKGRAYAPYLKEWSQTTDKGYTPKTWIMGGSGVSTGQGLYVDLNSDRNFYGRYEKEISISYDANGGEGTAGEQKGTVTATVKETETEIKGASVKLNNGTAFNLKGYLVNGWRDGPNGTEIVPAGSSVTLDKDTVFYAEWVPETFQITYLLDGGTVAGNPKSYTIESSNITLKNPTRTGYTFTGWSGTDLSGSNNKDVTIQAGSTGDREYTAHWTAVDYIVKLNGKGGSGGTDLTTYTYGTEVPLPTDWKRTGYSFEGWYDNEACDGEKVTEISTTDVGNKEYWAKWTDDIAPVIGSLRYSYQPKNLWNWLIGNDSLTVTVPVTEEGSGADEITYTVTSAGAAGSKQTAAIANGKAQVTVSADFKGTVAIACTDKAGNTSADVTVGAGLNATGIIIEDNAPQISFLVNGGAVSAEAYDSAPDITVTVTDDKENAVSGGIASVSYQIGNSGETEIQQNFTASMKTSATFTIPAAQIPNGDTTITVKAVDHAGNTATATQTIRVKTEAEKVAAAKKILQDTLADITATNETTKEDIQNAIDTALSDAGITDVTVTVGDLNKTEATSSAPGNLSGSVSVESKADSSVKDSVTINKTIAKLPVSEAEKVAAAKKVVQDTLADITATNETTKEDIQNAIDTALSDAGITDVTVTVGNLTKTEATSSAPGNLSGSVSVESKADSSVKDSVTINKTIAKLPVSEAEKVAAAKKIVQDVLADITVTNETTKEDMQNAIDTALSDAGITDVTVTVGDLSKTDATTGATGSLSGTVSVTSQKDSSVEDSVTINKTIAKLPATEAEKVAAAKKIVQDVLADITVTNETTKEDMQNAIDTALSDAGITDVTVTIGNLTKTEASSDAPGNISGSVSIVSKKDGTARDDASINKTIPATGESHTHNYEEWRHDAKEHWKVCSCGAEGIKSKHRYDNNKDTTCNDCGYKRKVNNPDKGESDKDKPGDADNGTPQPTDTPQPPQAQQPVNPPAAMPVKTPQPVPGTAGDPAKQSGAQTPTQPEGKPGQGTGQESKATVQQGGMDSAKITAKQRSEGETAQTDSVQQSEGSTAQTDRQRTAVGGQYGTDRQHTAVGGHCGTDNMQQSEDAAVQTVQAEETGQGHKCGLCHICPTFLGICYFIWLTIIAAAASTGIILLRKKRN